MPSDSPRSRRSTPSRLDRTPPSATAQARLSDALRDRADAYRQDASIDLTMVEALLRVDEPEAAARTIDDHRQVLLAMAHDLQVAVADAAVEREAEAVCEAAQTTLPQVHTAPVPLRAPAGGLRRRVLTLAGAAAVVVALILPQARLSPRTTLASVQGGSAQDDLAGALDRLEAAKSWARALRGEAPAVTAAVPGMSRRAQSSARSTTDLAADDPGGSAAPSSSSAEVVDLQAYRSSRDAAAAADRPAAGEPDEPVADVPHPDDTVPQVGVPLTTDGGIDIGGDPSETPSEADPLLP